MSQRGGGGKGAGLRRSKPQRGPPKADDHHSRPAKNKPKSSDAYHEDSPREGPVGETKIEAKSQKEVSITETTYKQDAQEDVGKKEPKNVTLDSNCNKSESVNIKTQYQELLPEKEPNCNKSECVNIKKQYQELLTEKEHYMKIIKQLKEEIQQLTSKDCKNNSPKEIMEVDTSTKHMASPRDTSEHVTGPSSGDAYVRNSELAEKSHKLIKTEAKEDSRSQKHQSLEQVEKKKWADDNIEGEESACADNGAGIQQSCSIEVDFWTHNNRESGQQDASWGNETQDNRVDSQQSTLWSNAVEDETKNRQCWQQETNQDDAAEISNSTDKSYEQNRNKKQRSTYYDISQPSRSNGSGGTDRRPHSGMYGGGNRYYRQQGKERDSWRNNQAGEQSVKRRRVLHEVEGDLFTAPKTCSLAHCVAEDMRMGSGIAVTFRQVFKRVDELLAQGARTGGLAVLKGEEKFIYYLVTKRLSIGKPYLQHLRSSLIAMRQHMLENKVHDVAMPRIGCGLDRLEWSEVRRLLIEIFGEDDVNITVYNFNQDQGERNQPRSSLRVTHAGYSLAEIETGTGLLYLGSEDGAVSESLENLLSKFPILQQYRQSTRHVGQFIRTECKNEILYGLIIKKNGSDEFSFTAFSQCLTNLKKVIQKDQYEFAGIEVTSISDDPELDTEKLLTIFKNAWFRSYLHLYVCWPEKYFSVYKKCYEESQKFRKQ